jgi:hypothetical protein
MRLRDTKGRFRKSSPIIIGLLVFGAFLGGTLSSESIATEYSVVEKIVEETKTDERLREKIREMKDEVLDILHEGESNGKEMEDGELFYTNDPNSRMREECSRIGGRRNINCDSFGPLQMKIGTIQHFNMKMYGKEITQVDALLLALDLEGAKKWTEDCFMLIEGCIWEWTSAQAHKPFLVRHIPLIRELEEVLNNK